MPSTTARASLNMPPVKKVHSQVARSTGKIGRHQINRDKRIHLILTTATAMFREAGYDATRIEDIAQQAGVSPGTVYSYFETKENILLSILSLHRSGNVQRRLGIVESPPDDVVKALVDYEKTLLKDATEYLDIELWRRITAAGIMATQSAVGRQSVHIDHYANQERLRILNTLKERGVLAADFPVEPITELLRAASYHIWIRFLRGEFKTLAVAKEAIAGHVGFILGHLTQSKRRR